MSAWKRFVSLTANGVPWEDSEHTTRMRSLIWVFEVGVGVGHMQNLYKLLYRGSNSELTLLLLNTTCPVLGNSVDPDQLASEEANWSGSALFVIKYVNFYQNPDQVIW